ncbi:MAG TPA: hypothetical protein VEB65_13530, partial [Solirubrobacterales bacterium]|nr:hypothetical protein [Solirubrobacterales bacterium]
RLRARDGEAGLTLIEMLVAATMSVILVGASTAMLISAVRDQPALSRKAENITTARWQLERIVREIRNGVSVEVASPSELAIVTQMRREECGGNPAESSSAEAIKCRVVYRCAGTTCTRTEATLDGTSVGTPAVALSGVRNAGSVFCFVPSAAEDPTECGTPKAGEKPTYVGIQLEVPGSQQRGLLTISDGATLRTATFSG